MNVASLRIESIPNTSRNVNEAGVNIIHDIVRRAPDVLDLVVAMLANPLAGLGVAVNKIAEKA